MDQLRLYLFVVYNAHLLVNKNSEEILDKKKIDKKNVILQDR